MSEKNQEKRNLTVQFTQRVTYRAEIKVTEDEYQMLNEADGEDIPQIVRGTLKPHPVYAFLEEFNNDNYFYDAEAELEDFEIIDTDE